MEEIKLYPWQHKALEEATTKNYYALLAGLGTGKTLAMIEIMRMRMNQEKRFMRTLIISPLSVLWQWSDEIVKFSKIPKDRIFIINGTEKNKSKQLELATSCNGAICITNYETIISEKIGHTFLSWKPEIMILDESHKIKSHTAKRTKSIIRLGQLAKFRFLMTGTLILNSIADVFSQYLFLNPEIFGKNYYSFQVKYMYDKNAGWKSGANYFPDWKPRPEMFDDLNEKIYSCAIRVTPEETIKDLPPLVTITKDIEMSPAQKKSYKQMEKEFVTWIKDKKGELNTVEAQLAITKALRMQQITCGFVITDEGKVLDIPGENSRLNMLKELLEEITIKDKVIIWTVFKATYKHIADLCTELKVGYTFLTGEQSGEEKRDAMKDFQENPKCQVIISNPSSGGTGTCLTAAKYAIYYSKTFSLGDYLQSMARNRRGGSGALHDTIFHVHINARESLDKYIFEALNGKEDIAKAIIDRIKNENA